MHQVAVRAVDLDYLETGPERAARRLHKCGDDGVNPGVRQLDGSGILGLERDRAGRHGGPAAGGLRNAPAAFPRAARTGLAAGVSKLDSGHRAVFPQKARNALERRDVLVLPDAGIFRRNAPARLHGGGFGHHQAGAAHGPAAQVDQVPVGGQPVHRGVLAHGRDGDAVAKRDIAHGQRSEQVRAHGSISAFAVERLHLGGIVPGSRDARGIADFLQAGNVGGR